VTARRPIEISTPRGADAVPIPLRAITRPSWPAFLMPPLEVVLDLHWLSPITVEGPAPMPSRRFDHVARILAQPALGETEATRRN
jgi:hypothetical protein